MKPYALLILLLAAMSAAAQAPPRIRISDDGKGFALDGVNTPFVPWGFNYDRDFKKRLIEDYWETDWDTVVADFKEMKRLGANVVRVHLQYGKFMEAPARPNAAALARLGKLVDLAESAGLYLDLTGLGCYRLADVPAWYDALSEQERWSAQANFWAAIAQRCAARPGVMAYDLMNEPVAAGDHRAAGKWVHESALGDFHYVQFLALDAGGRPREEIWRAWSRQMVAAIRRHDPKRPVTIGLLPLMGPKDLDALAGELDYLSVHIYPAAGKVDDAVKLARAFAVGKPLVIEETFPLSCGVDDLRRFIERTRGIACGWMGFYWGPRVEMLKQSKEPVDQLQLAWLELFQSMNAGKTP